MKVMMMMMMVVVLWLHAADFCSVSENLRESLNIRENSWIMQQANDPNWNRKSTSDWLKTTTKILEWPSQILDFNLMEMLC